MSNDLATTDRTALLAEANLAHFLGLLRNASAAVSAFHGYRRNNESIGWGIGWGVLGWVFPAIVPAIAIAQGFGKPPKKGG